MDPDYITPETLGGEDATSEFASSPVAEPVSAVSSPDAADTLSLSELNSMLGKNYTNKETALKSLKDTFNFVGKRKEDIKPEIDPSKFISRDQYETDMFYSKNSKYDTPEARRVIDAIAKTENLKPSDVVASDTFKAIFSKVEGYDTFQSEKSVLETNPRLASAKDTMAKAQDMMNAGNKDQAENMIARAVLEAMK